MVGAVMMWGISGRLKKKYDIHGDVRQQLYAAADDWTDALGASKCALHYTAKFSCRPMPRLCT